MSRCLMSQMGKSEGGKSWRQRETERERRRKMMTNLASGTLKLFLMGKSSVALDVQGLADAPI